MAWRLASVPEGSTTGSTTPYRPRNSYRELIRSVAGSEWRVISGSNCSSNSGASSSCLSSNSDFSLAGSAPTREEVNSDVQELREIAREMVNKGYTQRMVQAFDLASSAPTFGYGSGQDRALQNWFFDLDVDWVLQSRNELGSARGKSVFWLQDLAERWIRALTVIVASITGLFVDDYDWSHPYERVTDVHETLAVARFCNASISSMLVFVDTVIHVSKVEKLQAGLHMYICISSASNSICWMEMIDSEAQSIFNDIGSTLYKEGNRLIEDILNTMMHLRVTLMKDDASWASEILRGKGEVHRNIRFLGDCIALMRKGGAFSCKEYAWMEYTESHGTSTRKLRDLIDGTIAYTKDLLVSKSELCSNPSLRYMFLLNNSNFVAHQSKPPHMGLQLIPECEKYINIYLDVTWGDVVSCIFKSNIRGSLALGRWFNTSPLAKFQSAFHKTYKAQKFWKVPDPQLRSFLRKAITERVISSYRDYLGEHPELAEQISRGNSTPDALEEMLGELFEG